MASHFKQPSEEPRPQRKASRHAAPAGGHAAPAGAHSSPRASRPASRPADVGFVPIMSSGENARGHNRRRRGESHYAETDPYDLSGRRSKDPRKRAGRVVSTVLFVVGIALLLGAGGMWLHSQWQYHEQDVINEELATHAVVSDDGVTAPQVDWAGLKAINSEAVGWIQIPGTVVNFPVYQGSDNDKYLNTNAEGNYSVGGQIFLDAENTAPGMADDQSIVYGHHLRNGAMFKPVYDMTNQEMFDGVSTVWYVTEQATYELEPLLLYETDGSDANVRTFNFSSDEELRTYLTDLLGRSVTRADNADELIASAQNVLSLCTCNYESADWGRTILVCVPKPAADAAS